jgi:hypothetical protein
MGGEEHMNDLRQAAEMALEALEFLVKNELSKKRSVKAHFNLVTIPALRQALAQPEREWVGLDGEIPGLGLVTEEFYNGMIFAEDILKEKNT